MEITTIINIILNICNSILILYLFKLEMHKQKGEKIEFRKVLNPTVLPKRKKGRVYSPKKDLDNKMMGNVVDPFDD